MCVCVCVCVCVYYGTQALDVSGDGEIEYGEFVAAFKPVLTSYPYDLEAAVEAVAAQVLIRNVCVVCGVWCVVCCVCIHL